MCLQETQADLQLVSILVLLDYGALREAQESNEVDERCVSILVLLDYGALSLRAPQESTAKHCFNPCFVGLWGFEPALPKL